MYWRPTSNCGTGGRWVNGKVQYNRFALYITILSVTLCYVSWATKTGYSKFSISKLVILFHGLSSYEPDGVYVCFLFVCLLLLFCFVCVCFWGWFLFYFYFLFFFGGGSFFVFVSFCLIGFCLFVCLFVLLLFCLKLLISAHVLYSVACMVTSSHMFSHKCKTHTHYGLSTCWSFLSFPIIHIIQSYSSTSMENILN